MLSWLDAIWLAIVQGLTEFLPVSSSGHLAIAGKLLHVNTEAGGDLFSIVLHLGTLISICMVYSKDVWNLIREAVLLIVDGIAFLVNRKAHPFRMYPERKMVLMVLIASLPTLMIGVVVESFLEDFFMSSLIAVGFALCFTAVLLLFSGKIRNGHKELSKMSARDAVVIGTMQGIATLPGVSRSGSTIVAGLAGGYSREFAIRFSFLLSIPAVAGAALLKLVKAEMTDLSANAGPYLLGMLVAAVIGFLCIKLMLRLLRKDRFHYFGYYCAVMGLVAIVAGMIM